MSTLALGAVITDLLLNRSRIEVSRLPCFALSVSCGTASPRSRVCTFKVCIVVVVPPLGAAAVALVCSWRIRFVYVQTVRVEAALSEMRRI